MLGRFICTLLGHHPDDDYLAPVGFTVDGDFVVVSCLSCRRCGTREELWVVNEPVPVWANER